MRGWYSNKLRPMNAQPMSQVARERPRFADQKYSPSDVPTAPNLHSVAERAAAFFYGPRERVPCSAGHAQYHSEPRSTLRIHELSFVQLSLDNRTPANRVDSHDKRRSPDFFCDPDKKRLIELPDRVR